MCALSICNNIVCKVATACFVNKKHNGKNQIVDTTFSKIIFGNYRYLQKTEQFKSQGEKSMIAYAEMVQPLFFFRNLLSVPTT